MYDVSAFMKALKQNATMSYNCRSVHPGRMWEFRSRVREYMPDEKCELMNVAAYSDCSGSIALRPREEGWSRELFHHSYSTISPTFHVREQNPSGCWGFARRSSLHGISRRYPRRFAANHPVTRRYAAKKVRRRGERGKSG